MRDSSETVVTQKLHFLGTCTESTLIFQENFSLVSHKYGHNRHAMHQTLAGDGHLPNFWEQYPYFLPMLPTALLALVCVPLFLFSFPETLPTHSCTEATSLADTETEHLLTQPPSSSREGTDAQRMDGLEDRAAPFRCCRSFCEAHPNLPSACKLLAIPDVVICIGTYSCMLFVAVTYNDIMGLWAAATPDAGGLGWTTDTTGTFLSVLGLGSSIWSFVLYPLTLAKWRLRSQLQFGQLSLLPALMCLPFASRFQSSEGGVGDWKLWVPLVLMGLSVQIPLVVCFVAANSITNNSVSTRQRVRRALSFLSPLLTSTPLDAHPLRLDIHRNCLM